MNHLQLGEATRDILGRLDIAAMRRLFAEKLPNNPPMHGDFEVLKVMHYARTQSHLMPVDKRAYSHQWLLANGLPSGLPKELLPEAEKLDFKFAYGVGIAVVAGNANDPEKVRLAKELEQAMAAAAAEAVHDGRLETDFLRRRMAEARDRRLRQLSRPRVTVTVSHDFGNLPAPGPHVR